MIIYDIWMCLKVGYAENQVFFFRGYHIFREIQTLSRTDIGEFFLVHQQGFLKCQTLESSSLICGQPLQCLVVSNKPFAIVYIYISCIFSYVPFIIFHPILKKQKILQVKPSVKLLFFLSIFFRFTSTCTSHLFSCKCLHRK